MNKLPLTLFLLTAGILTALYLRRIARVGYWENTSATTKTRIQDWLRPTPPPLGPQTDAPTMGAPSGGGGADAWFDQHGSLFGYTPPIAPTAPTWGGSVLSP